MNKYIAPGQNNYPGLDRGFNQRYKLDSDLTNAKGEGIYIVDSSTDIVEVLTEISTHNPSAGEVRIISGGHCYEDFTFQSKEGNTYGTRFVIDLSNMRGIYEETVADTQYVVVEPGASNWLIQQKLHSVYGAALPGGSCYSVCAGGHIAGGGYGLLSRLHGLTVDYLAGVEMIISDGADGFKIRAFDTADTDKLNWACRGAGAGHFGVITKYYFAKDKLPASPENALFVTLPVAWHHFIKADGSVDGAEFNKFMQRYYVACKALPPQAFTLGKFTCMTSPDDIMSISMQVVYGAGSGHDAMLGGTQVAPMTKIAALEAIANFSGVLSPWVSAPETSFYHRKPFRLTGHPVSGAILIDTIYDLPWIDITQMLNGSGENQNGKYKSSYIAANFDLAESTAMAEFLTDTQAANPAPADVDKSQTLIQIDSYGAQINSMDINETPVNTAIAARGSILKTQYQTYWKNYEDTGIEPAQREKNIITWFNAGYNSIHAQAQGNIANNGFPLWGNKYQGCYFNYPDRQIGVNNGYKKDPGDTYNGQFLELYFGSAVAAQLKEIKGNVDPNNFFTFAQSIPL